MPEGPTLEGLEILPVQAFSACLTTYQGLYFFFQGKEGGGDFFPRSLVLSILL